MTGKTFTLRLYLAGLVLSLALVFGVHDRLHAQQRELKTDATDKIDAVLVLDASGSMRLTDPQRLRDEGARLFTQFLKPGDRLAIVEFAGTAKVIRPLSDYDREKADQITREITNVDNSGAYTNILVGIKTAREVLEKNKRPDAGQVIILLSDGKMDPDPKVGTGESLTNELFSVDLPKLKAEGIKINTLAFSDQADKDFLSQVALATEGLGIYAADADKIHQAYANLFLAVKKPQVLPLTGKGFKIDNDVQEATFYINREDASDVIIQSPSGRQITSDVSDPKVKWFKGQKFDVITILSPESGAWKVAGLPSNDGFATLLTNLKLITGWDTNITVGEQKLLQARLYENDKPVVLPEMTGAVDYAFQITPTDRVSEPLVRDFLNDKGEKGDKLANDGIFSSSVTIQEPGEYTLKVAARAPTFERYQQIPFKVKPRIVSLRVEKSGETAGAHGRPDDQGHEKQDPHEDTHGDHADGRPGEDLFVAGLSPETRQLSGIEVKIVAVDKNRTRYNITMHATGDPLRYEIGSSVLSGEGRYELQASLTGKTRSKKNFKASSETVEYLKKPSRVVKEVEVTEVIKKEEKPEVKTESPVLYLILLTIGNLLTGAVFFLLLKKSGGTSVSVPSFESAEPARSMIAKLQQKISMSEVDLTDPDMLSGADAEPAGAEAQAEAAAPAEESQPADAAGGSGAIEEEKTATEEGA